MSKSPINANRTQEILYRQGQIALGEGVASTKPDHIVRRKGLGYLGRKAVLATGATVAAFTLANNVMDSQPDVPKLEDTYVVQPGDNPWSIAKEFTPEGKDPRGLHDQLTSQDAFREDGVLTPGETLQVPTTVAQASVEEMSQRQVKPGEGYDNNPGSHGS